MGLKPLSDIEVKVLRAVKQANQEGYDPTLLEVVRALNGGAGTITPALTRLEQRGFVASYQEDAPGIGSRWRYKVTERGAFALAELPVTKRGGQLRPGLRPQEG